MNAQPSIHVPQWTQGDRLRKAREDAGLSQVELAERIGVSRATVSNAEVGARDTLEVTVRAWALATGVPVRWLQTGEAPSGPRGQSDVGRRVSDTELMQNRSYLIKVAA